MTVLRRRLVVLAVVAALLGAGGCTGDEGPERVLLVGDSVMHQMAAALRADVPSGVDIRNEAVSGSGLLTPWLFDWERHLPRVLAAYQPDVVVFLFVGNYRLGGDRAYEHRGERVEERGSDLFFEAWEARASRLGDLAAEDAEVVWVLPPPMQSAEDQHVVDGLRDIHDGVAEDDDATTVDAEEVLAGPDGEFLASTEQADGSPIRLRTADGVHLAPGGARRLAGLVSEALADCCLGR